MVRWSRGGGAGVVALALVVVTGCVSEPGGDDGAAGEDGGADGAEESAEPNITDADLSGLAVLNTETMPSDMDLNPLMILDFRDPSDGSLRTSLPLTAMAEDTQMREGTVRDMSIHVDGAIPDELDFSADFRRMAWENAETGAVHVAELDDVAAEYRLLRSFEADGAATLSGERERYTDVQLSPDGSRAWFVRVPEGTDEDDPQEIVYADLDGGEDGDGDGEEGEAELTRWGEVPADAGTAPAGDAAYWDVTWDNEPRVMERDTSEGDDYELTFYSDGSETVPYEITIADLGERSGEHEYGAIRRIGADTYVAKASEQDSDSGTKDQIIAFRITDGPAVEDIELRAEITESRVGDIYPDLENDDLLMAVMGTSETYEPFYAMPLDSAHVPRLRFEELPVNEEHQSTYENIVGIYPADKSESAVIPQLR